MTDADLQSRLSAVDRDGRLVAWTPEAVGLRIIESYRVLDKTPMRVGPKADQGYWPGVTATWEDLLDDTERARLIELYAAYDRRVDWESEVRRKDPGSVNLMVMDRRAEFERLNKKGAPNPAAYSRTEEALRWASLYLSDRPLLADAIGVWGFCIATGRSIRKTLAKRRQLADERARFLPGSRRQEIMPGKNFDGRLAWERRKAGCATICAGLIAGRVLLKVADEIESVVDGLDDE